MLHHIGKMRSWPIWLRLGLAVAIVAATFALQFPFETHVPGEPFLLFFIVVVALTVVFGNRTGFLATGLSTILSCLFFVPDGSVAFYRATDLIKVELYA